MSIPWECTVPTILTLPLPLLCNSDHGIAWLPLLLLLHLLLLIQAPPPAIAQSENTQPPSLPDRFSSLRFDKSMAIVLVILVVVFFILGFLSVYTRQCAERRIMGRLNLPIPIIGSERRPRGLPPEIIDTFPTFFYSAVKGLKIGRATLECAVCLNEFQDDETLRLIPQCCHVFHPHCIDVWLATHSTCPVCRANLAPRPGDMSFVAVQIPDPAGVGSNQPDPGTDSGHQLHHNNGQVGDIDDHHNRAAESPKVDSVNQNRPPRSRSTGFGIGSLFPRSHSTGHDSLVQPGENRERFTLRLPAEVRNQLVSSTLHRANSCGETFTRESSGRRGYRTRSMGSARERSHLQSERFGSEARPDRWGFTWTPPFVSRTGSTKLTKGLTESNKPSAATERDNVGERSSDRLFAGSEEN